MGEPQLDIYIYMWVCVRARLERDPLRLRPEQARAVAPRRPLLVQQPRRRGVPVWVRVCVYVCVRVRVCVCVRVCVWLNKIYKG